MNPTEATNSTEAMNPTGRPLTSVSSIGVRILKLKPEAQIPEYKSRGAAGCDIHALLEQDWEVAPSERVAVPTGLAVEIPEGYEIQVRPRSGLAYKSGLTLINSPGTIDSDYRGEIKVLMINLSKAAVRVTSGERIAQLVLQRVPKIEWTEVQTLVDSDRGQGGFGSTGKL